MALYVKSVLIRYNSGIEQDVIAPIILKWLSNFDSQNPNDEFFAFVIDLKFFSFDIAFSPVAQQVYGIAPQDAYVTIAPIGANYLTEAKVKTIVNEAIATHLNTSTHNSPSTIDWSALPADARNEIKDKAVQGILDQMPPTQDMVDEVVARSRATINVKPSDIAGDAIALLMSELRGQLDLQQAQSDLVAEGTKVLLREMDGIKDSAQVEAFRTVLAGLATQNAELISALDADQRVEVNIL